jgi:hypothetical protein
MSLPKTNVAPSGDKMNRTLYLLKVQRLFCITSFQAQVSQVIETQLPL